MCILSHKPVIFISIVQQGINHDKLIFKHIWGKHVNIYGQLFPVETILKEYLARLVYPCKKRSFFLHLARSYKNPPGSCRNLAQIAINARFLQDPC